MKVKKHQKILLVEDDLISGFIAERILKKSKFASNYHWVKNGMEAINWLSENNADYVFLDISMPVMDGFDVLKALADSGKGLNLKIVILTSSGRTSDKEKCLNYDFVNAYLEKPLSEEKFDKIILKLEQI
ncbi:MAG: CheY-like chemotaxis protein [Flavobacteriales bacterium]|jgi:CheY-like chemotaxis protein